MASIHDTMTVPAMEAMQQTNGSQNLRDSSLCELLNRALDSGLATLIVNCRQLRVPISRISILSNGWLECVIADESERDDTARIVVKNYTPFTLYFGSEHKELNLL
jgi:hypothetical protein